MPALIASPDKFARCSLLMLLLMLVLLGLCLCGLCQPAAAQSLHTIDTIDLNAKFEGFEKETGLLFSIDGQKRKLDIDRIVRWGSWPGVRDQSAIWLSDGSWLCGTIEIHEDALTVTSDWWQIPRIPLAAVRGLILSPPATMTRWLEIQRQMAAVEGQSDVLWLTGGRKITGVIRWPHKLSGNSIDTLDIDTAGQVVPLPLDTVAAIAFSPTLLGPLPAYSSTTRLGLQDGSLLFCNHLSISTTKVTAMLESSLELNSLDEAAVFSESVVMIEGTAAGTISLGQLEPTSYRHLSDSTLTWELGRDKDIRGDLLHTPAGISFRGLACHSSSQVAYRWDGSAAQFLCEARLAAAAPYANQSLGSVNCQVLVARQAKLEKVHEFTLKRSGHTSNGPPQSAAIDVDLTDARLVVLVTEKSDYGQYGDQLLWLDARISPKRPNP